MYHHPKYYKEMRAERKKLQAASSKLQAASLTASPGDDRISYER